MTWPVTGVGWARLRSRLTSWRMAMPQSHAPTSPSPRKPPGLRQHGDEGVVDGLGDQVLVRRTTTQAEQQPGRVPLDQLAQGERVALGHQAEELDVRQRLHAHTVARTGPIGSLQPTPLRGLPPGTPVGCP